MENGGLLMCEEFLRREFLITEAMAGYNRLRDGGLLCEANNEVMAERAVELLHNDNLNARLSWNALAVEFFKAVARA